MRNNTDEVWEWWQDSEPMIKKEFLKTSLVQKGDFIKARGRTHGQKELPQDPEERLVIYYGVGEGKVQEKFPKGFSYAKEDSQDSGDLAIVKLRWFFPSSKVLTLRQQGVPFLSASTICH